MGMSLVCIGVVTFIDAIVSGLWSVRLLLVLVSLSLVPTGVGSPTADSFIADSVGIFTLVQVCNLEKHANGLFLHDPIFSSDAVVLK